MEHIYIVDTALAEVPINDRPIVDASTLAIKADLAYNASGLALIWHFITPGGAYTQTAVTPTDTGGAYDWVVAGNGVYTIELPASGGAVNNDTEGTGWFTGFATGYLPWRSPMYRFLPAASANALGLGTNFVTTADLDTAADIRTEIDSNSTQLADIVTQGDDNELLLHAISGLIGTPGVDLATDIAGIALGSGMTEGAFIAYFLGLGYFGE